MSSVSKSRVTIALTFAIVATTMVWLVLGESSPFYDYFLFNVTVPNIVGRLITIPYIIMMILRPRTGGDALAYIFVFLQWFLVGYIIAALFVRKKESFETVSIRSD